jgi:hypothetical protein
MIVRMKVLLVLTAAFVLLCGPVATAQNNGSDASGRDGRPGRSAEDHGGDGTDGAPGPNGSSGVVETPAPPPRSPVPTATAEPSPEPTRRPTAEPVETASPDRVQRASARRSSVVAMFAALGILAGAAIVLWAWRRRPAG